MSLFRAPLRGRARGGAGGRIAAARFARVIARARRRAHLARPFPPGSFSRPPATAFCRNAERRPPGSRLSLLSFYTISPNVKCCWEQKMKLSDTFHGLPVETRRGMRWLQVHRRCVYAVGPERGSRGPVLLSQPGGTAGSWTPTLLFRLRPERRPKPRGRVRFDPSGSRSIRPSARETPVPGGNRRSSTGIERRIPAASACRAGRR